TATTASIPNKILEIVFFMGIKWEDIKFLFLNIELYQVYPLFLKVIIFMIFVLFLDGQIYLIGYNIFFKRKKLLLKKSPS
ncbi:MAG: hypothetical protein WCO66_03275, partial [Candidatus Absconditabacteria bacterium]